jgi:adenosylmethionine-8-amino-7-oxononanoate aminotransferase
LRSASDFVNSKSRASASARVGLIAAEDSLEWRLTVSYRMLAPPFVTTEAELDEMASTLDRALHDAGL